jgi:aspartyl-tRNA(Asn)/glutamyl-tRNA(Gln) amidotransferase subunit A
VDYLRAQRIRTLLIRDLDARFRDVDAFVAPTGGPSVTMTNFTGHPSLTMNAGFVDDLPVGLMVTGRYYEESTLLRIGWAFQQRTDAQSRRPGFE